MVEVEVEVEWMDDVFVENPALLVGQHSMVRHVPHPRRRSKEVQSVSYIQDLIFLDF